MEGWVPVTVVADFLSCSVDTVYRRIQEGLPARRFGMEWRFKLSEVDAWLAGGTATVVSLTDKRRTG